MQIIHPIARQIELQPVEGEGRWMGEMLFDVPGTEKPGFWPRVAFRVEAYALDSTDETTIGLVGELEALAECGGPLTTIQVEGRAAYLVVIPKGA